MREKKKLLKGLKKELYKRLRIYKWNRKKDIRILYRRRLAWNKKHIKDVLKEDISNLTTPYA